MSEYLVKRLEELVLENNKLKEENTLLKNNTNSTIYDPAWLNISKNSSTVEVAELRKEIERLNKEYNSLKNKYDRVCHLAADSPAMQSYNNDVFWGGDDFYDNK